MTQKYFRENGSPNCLVLQPIFKYINYFKKATVEKFTHGHPKECQKKVLKFHVHQKIVFFCLPQ